MNSIDEADFSNRKEFRLYDRINFRLKQEILLRDDEINRLKKRLETIKRLKQSNYKRGNITSGGYSDQLTYLQNQIYVETNKAEMKLTNSSILHSQKIEQMKQKFKEEIYYLKQELNNKVASGSYASYQTDENSEQIDQFLDSLENIVHSNKRKKRYDNGRQIDYHYSYGNYDSTKSKSDDVVFTDSRSFDLHLYNDEIQDNENRIKQIRQLIQKYEECPDYSTLNYDSYFTDSTFNNNNNSNFKNRNNQNQTASEYSIHDSQNDLGNYSSIVDDSDIIHKRTKINQLIDKHKKQVDILKAKIKRAKMNTKYKQRKIEIASSDSYLTDAEIAETIKTQEKIKKMKEKKNSLMITIESLSEMDLNQREEVLKRLKIENLILKREIARVDSVAYGRKGKYQYWRKLSDEELLKCSVIYYT